MASTLKSRSLRFQPINIVLALHFGLALGFDYLSEDTRLALAGIIAGSYALLAVLASLRESKAYEGALLIIIVVMSIGWIISYIFVSEYPSSLKVSLGIAFRNLAPFFAAIALLGNRHGISPRLIVVGCALILGSAIFHAVAMPMVYLSNIPRFGSFSAGLHTSAYTLSLAAILIVDLFRQRIVSRTFTVVFVVTGSFIVFGYGVRTVFLLVSIFFIFDFIAKWLRKTRADVTQVSFILWVLVFVFILIISIVISSWSFGELSNFSSGRISNYFERFSAIWQRSFSAFLFGTGPGSDEIVTDVWWWAAKDAHNDFIHLFWEGGIPALLGTWAFLLLLLKPDPIGLLAPLAAVIASSAVSNALLVRPNSAFLMFCLIALRTAHPIRFHQTPKKRLRPSRPQQR